jgi:hypothetical protein
MLSTLLLAVLTATPQAYDGTLVLTMPSWGVGSRTWIGGVTVTEDDTVAGFTCDSVGVHGEAMLGKPFAWSKGTLHWLPLGGAEYGHVYADTSGVLVGDVEIDYREDTTSSQPRLPATGIGSVGENSRSA